MNRVTVVAVVFVVLAFSASVMWVACGEGPGTSPAPALDASETATSSSPSSVTNGGVDENDHRAALITAAADRAEKQLEVATSRWVEMGVPQDEVDRRASDVRAYIDETRRNGLPKLSAERRALMMERFRQATQRAMERGRISLDRGTALLDQYEDYLDKKEYH